MASLLALVGVLVAWLLAVQQAREESTVLWFATGFACVVTGFWVWRWQRGLPGGWLVWTGVAWRLQPASKAASVDPNSPAFEKCERVLDLQSALLLRLHGVVPGEGASAKRSVWVWAHQAADPQNWHALRVAVVWAQQAQNAPQPAMQAGNRA